MIVSSLKPDFSAHRDPSQKREPESSDLFAAIFADQRAAQRLLLPEQDATSDFALAAHATRPGTAVTDPGAINAGTRSPAAPSDSLATASESASARRVTPANPAPTQHEPQAGTALINQGTLPVLIAGQLIELTVLRDRRPVRDATPTRRLTMTLPSTTAGEIRVEAQVHDERLVIDFTGGTALDAANYEERADEVRSLAERLGWTFTESTWSSSE